MVSALKNAVFFGKRLYLEIAAEGKDYAGQGNTGGEVKLNRAERRRREQEKRGNFNDRRRGGRTDDRRTSRDAERGFGKKGGKKKPDGNFDKFKRNKPKKSK